MARGSKEEVERRLSERFRWLRWGRGGRLRRETSWQEARERWLQVVKEERNRESEGVSRRRGRPSNRRVSMLVVEEFEGFAMKEAKRLVVSSGCSVMDLCKIRDYFF